MKVRWNDELYASKKLLPTRVYLTLLLESRLTQPLDLSSFLCRPSCFLKNPLPRFAILESHSFLRCLDTHATLLVHGDRLPSFHPCAFGDENRCYPWVASLQSEVKEGLQFVSSESHLLDLSMKTYLPANGAPPRLGDLLDLAPVSFSY